MEGLYDEPRRGAPREIGDEEIAAMIRRTLEARPNGATHWKPAGHGQGNRPRALDVHRIWRAFGL